MSGLKFGWKSCVVFLYVFIAGCVNLIVGMTSAILNSDSLNYLEVLPMKKVLSTIVAALVALSFSAVVFAADVAPVAAPAADAKPAVEKKEVKKVKKAKKAKKAVKKEAAPAVEAAPAK